MNPPRRKVHVFIVSDATGITAERVISAVLLGIVTYDANLLILSPPRQRKDRP